MKYGLHPRASGWFMCVRTRAGGFMTADAACLQDAYAWLFRRGVFDRERP